MTREEQVEALLRAKEVLEKLSVRVTKSVIGTVVDEQQVMVIGNVTMACMALGAIDLAIKSLEDGL